MFGGGSEGFTNWGPFDVGRYGTGIFLVATIVDVKGATVEVGMGVAGSVPASDTMEYEALEANEVDNTVTQGGGGYSIGGVVSV